MLKDVSPDQLEAISGGSNGKDGQPLAKMVTDNQHYWFDPRRWFGGGQTRRCSVSLDAYAYNERSGRNELTPRGEQAIRENCLNAEGYP